jgi:hypothetical protein
MTNIVLIWNTVQEIISQLYQEELVIDGNYFISPDINI